jgi:hypothetical protein
MLKKMMNIWLYLRIATDRISLVIKVWHQSSDDSEGEIPRSPLTGGSSQWPNSHRCSTSFPIRTSHGYCDKTFWDLSDKLIIGHTDMKVFFGRWLLINTRLYNLRSINDSLNIWVNNKIFNIYSIISMSYNHFQSMVYETISKICLYIIDTYDILIPNIKKHHR